MSRTKNRDSIEQRRVKVAGLLDACRTQREMAQLLGVSVATVNRDLKVLRERWRTEQIENVHQMMVEDLHRIAMAMRAIWPLILGGDTHAVDRLVKLIELRAKLLDYAPPQKVDLTSGGKPLPSAISRIVVHVTPEAAAADAQEDEPSEL